MSNEAPTIKLLKDGMFHRPYTSPLTKQRVEELAKQLGVQVEATEYQAQESDVRCVFEVKP